MVCYNGGFSYVGQAAAVQVLRFGSKGPDVGRVQRALNERMLQPNNTLTRPPMARLAEDNDFGSKTRAMVMEFQRLNGIAIDGVVGPDTSYLLFPYIAFTTVLAGQGPLRGTSRAGLPLSGRFPAPRFLLAQMSQRSRSLATDRLLAIGDGENKEEEPEGVGVEATVSPGFKREFKPWFVLKPDEPEGAKSFSIVTAEATILRKKGLEFGGQFEFSRPLGAVGGSRWIWEGTLSGKYTGLKAEAGPFSASLSPVVEAKVREGLQLGAAASAEAELSVELSKDLLELSVGGKVGAQWDIHEGNVQVGEEVTVGLKLKWEAIRFPRKKN
jgi:hypothetical protein